MNDIQDRDPHREPPMTIKEVANLLGRSEMTIRRYIDKGILRAVQSTGRDKGRWLISREDVEVNYGSVLGGVMASPTPGQIARLNKWDISYPVNEKGECMWTREQVSEVIRMRWHDHESSTKSVEGNN